MDFRTLQYFNIVARELNFTRAAKKLNMSQPPLSNTIKELEKDLGVTLFIRGKRQLALTEAGHLLVQRTAQILELGEKTKQDIALLKEELAGVIHLGMVEGRAPFLAARWITGFREEFPQVRFDIWNGSSDDVLEMLHEGKQEVAVIAAPYDGERLNSVSVGKEPWVAIIPKDHPLAKQESDSIPLSKLVSEPLIIPSRTSRKHAIYEWFATIPSEPVVIATMSSYIDSIALVEQGAGIAIFPQTTYTPNPHVVSKVITDPAKIVEYVLVWEKNSRPNGMTQQFIDYVKDFMEADRIHADRFHVREAEFQIPRDAELL